MSFEREEMKVMKKFKFSPPLTIWGLLLTLGTGCPLASGIFEVAVTVPSQQVKGTIVGSMLPLNDFKIPLLPAGQSKAPDQATSVQLTGIELRTVTSDPADGTSASLRDTSLMGKCRDGQADLGFIQELVIKIRKTTESDSEAKEIAHYTKIDDKPCSISLDTSMGPNLLPYLSGYQLVTFISGTGNSEDITLGGYIRVASDVEFPHSAGPTPAPAATAAPVVTPTPGSPLPL
jgi:hypothetical protein